MNKLSSIAIPAAAAALMLVSAAGISQASETAKCGDRAELAEILKEKFHQVPVGGGVSHENTHAFEVFASRDGGWTVLMTKTDGQTCIMAGGHSWEDFHMPVSGTPT